MAHWKRGTSILVSYQLGPHLVSEEVAPYSKDVNTTQNMKSYSPGVLNPRTADVFCAVRVGLYFCSLILYALCDEKQLPPELNI
jgi:hypothetical protein